MSGSGLIIYRVAEKNAYINPKGTIGNTEYGNMYVYSSGKNIIALEFYDKNSTRQLVFYVDSFLDIIPDPVSIDSFTKVSSLVNLFTQQ